MTDTNYDWEKELDSWEDKYQPIKNHIASEKGEDDDKFETFGRELEYVLSIANSEPNRVWTLVDGDDGNMYIVNGYHLVNRINYFITANAFDGEFLEVPYYIFEESEEEELSYE
jgi:hypothetical protein